MGTFVKPLIMGELVMETMQSITNIAANIIRNKKPTKKECFGTVEKAIQSGNSLSDYDLAKLYAYFMPNLPKKAKSIEEWVAKALPKKHDDRLWTNYIQVSQTFSVMFATNGHRLHVKRNPSIDPGAYDKAYNKITNDYAIFNLGNSTFNDIINKTYANERTFYVHELDVVTVGKYHAYKFKFGLYLNKQYLDEALNGESKFKIEYNDNESQVKITTDFLGRNDAFAIIMPIRGPEGSEEE